MVIFIISNKLYDKILLVGYLLLWWCYLFVSLFFGFFDFESYYFFDCLKVLNYKCMFIFVFINCDLVGCGEN